MQEGSRHHWSMSCCNRASMCTAISNHVMRCGLQAHTLIWTLTSWILFFDNSMLEQLVVVAAQAGEDGPAGEYVCNSDNA